jgi:uncharacterized protein (TIGR03382 family)
LALAAGLAGSAAAAGPGVGDLLVTEEGPGNVLHYNGATGAFINTFAVVPPPRALMGVHTGGPNGDVLVGSAGGGVRVYDRNSGALTQTINPTGGWQWAGVWRPNTGTVLVGDMATNDIREYDPVTGNYLSTFASGIMKPADMIYGPNGNLFVCSFDTGAGVYEIDANTGNIVNQWGLGMGFTNDLVFMPDGRRIVTAMGDNQAHVFDSSWNPIATFAGTGWGRPHGIDVSPWDGNIYVVDGMTQAVHVFDSTTYTELSANFLTTGTKPVDLEFRPAIPAPGAAALAGLAAVALGRRRRR